jgi:hypothetical protein
VELGEFLPPCTSIFRPKNDALRPQNKYSLNDITILSIRCLGDTPGDKNLGSSQEPSMFFIMATLASCAMIREARP